MAVLDRELDPGEDERTYWARRIWRPWVERTMSLRNATVLEYGCGPGSVSHAFVTGCKRYIGLDIDPESIAIVRRSIAEAGHEHAEFHAHPPEEIVEALRAYAGQVDVLLLYAVIEHLTVPERIAVLAAAREVVATDGIIVVIELPNRLGALDWHSSWLPFITQLPDALALDYLRDATRPELRELVLSHRDHALPAAEDAGALMALARFGRGASYHEFELAWGDSIAGYAVACNWEPEVIPHREFDPGELALARSLTRLAPQLDPSWGRQWIDVILRPALPIRRGPFHCPWIGAPGPASRGIVADALTDVLLIPSAGDRLHIELPEPTTRIAVRVVSGWDVMTLEAETISGRRADTELRSTPGTGATAVIDLPEPSDDLLLRVSGGAWILGVTYLGYGPGRDWRR